MAERFSTRFDDHGLVLLLGGLTDCEAAKPQRCEQSCKSRCFFLQQQKKGKFDFLPSEAQRLQGHPARPSRSRHPPPRAPFQHKIEFFPKSSTLKAGAFGMHLFSCGFRGLLKRQGVIRFLFGLRDVGWVGCRGVRGHGLDTENIRSAVDFFEDPRFGTETKSAKRGADGLLNLELILFDDRRCGIGTKYQ